MDVTDSGGGGGEYVSLDEVSVAVTGHTVVYNEMISVVTWPTGQFVTVGAQDVIVYTLVV